MRKILAVCAAPLMAVTVLGASPAAAEPSETRSEAAGGFKMTVHTHSSGTLIGGTADRLSYDFVEGESFEYSSRPCDANARFNDLGLDFTPDYPGVDDDADGTAAVRHIVEGTVTSVDGSGSTGTIEGTITSILCAEGDETANSIVTNFTTRYRVTDDNTLQLTGRYVLSPTQSTGTFAGITGDGSIKAVLTCLAAQRDPSQPTCAERGEYTDFVAARGDLTKAPGEIAPGLVGTFRDSTVLTG